MVSIFLKSLLLFSIGILIMRLMGKSAITQLTPYDLMAIIITGTIISEPLISTEVKSSIYALIIIIILYIMFSKLSLNQMFNKMLLGHPSILVKHGKIVEESLEKEHISLIHLTSLLRTSGYPKVDELEYVILEPTGEISIIPKTELRNVSISDLNISVEPEGLPIGIIIDGKIQKKNLELIHKDEDWLRKKLEDEEITITNIKDIVYAYGIEGKEEIYFDFRHSVRKNEKKNENPDKDESQKGKHNRDIIKTLSLEIVKDGKLNLGHLYRIGLNKEEIVDMFKLKNIKELEEFDTVVIEEKKEYSIKTNKSL